MTAATDTLGKYRILATLGRGGMGEVFLAAQEGPAGFRKLVVVKAMRTDIATDELFKKMLLDEARLAARLRHPNVVQTIEVGDVDGRPLIAMEYLEGQSLNAILSALKDKGERLSVAMATLIVSEALAGLHYAHELQDFDGQPLGIVHRDVTPHNIFVTYDGEVKLLDFGIAKATTNASETEIGTVKGKIAYMAPEQARGLALDRRADLFAVGLVLWECLTSKRMLEGNSTAAILEHLIYQPLPPVKELCPDLDPALEKALAHALEKSADQRFSTAQEMRQAIQPFARGTDREEIGRKVASMFEDERAVLAAKVRISMRPPRIDDGSTKTIRVASMEVIESDRSDVKTASKLQLTPPPSALTTATGVAVGPKKRSLLPILALGACVVAGGAFFAFGRRGSDVAKGTPSSSAAAGVAPMASADIAFRLQGSDTIGTELLPPLAEAFLKRQGALSVAREPDEAHHRLRLVGTFTAAPTLRAIDIASTGSSNAFAALADEECDIGMASRRPTKEEVARLKERGFGDPTSRASEHIVALDGIAIIVSPDNPLHALDQVDATRLFGKSAESWSLPGGKAGVAHAYVLDASSGTSAIFKQALGLPAFAPDARPFMENHGVSDAVAADPQGIGFVAMAYVGNAKAVALSAPGIPARQATPFTVATESYLLSRRLYLYTSQRPKRPAATDFVRFTGSPEGQTAVRTAGFVALGVGLAPPLPCDAKCPPPYAAATKSARRISLDFRFREGSTELDNRGMGDLDGLVAFLAERRAKVVLLGFSGTNVADSLQCAESVSRLLKDRGIGVSSVAGLGTSMPVAPATSDGALERNRRVEVWLKDDASAKADEAPGKAGGPKVGKGLDIRQDR